MGPNHCRHFFFETLILTIFWGPICRHFGSILAPLGTLGPPKVRFFVFRGDPARTFAHTARAGAILSEFGCPRGAPKLVGGTSGATSGDMVKLHVAPLGGALAWVSAHSAISEACTACKATD